MTTLNPIICRRPRALTRLAALCTVLALAAGVPCRAGEAGAPYVDPQYGYSLTVPAGWTHKTDMPKPYAAFLGPVEEGFRTNFHVDPEPAANKTLAEFVKVARETNAKNKAIKVQSERRAKLAGSPAVVFQSVVTLEGQAPSIARQYIAVHGGRGYTLTFAVAPAALKKFSPTFDKVAASFRWRK